MDSTTKWQGKLRVWTTGQLLNPAWGELADLYKDEMMFAIAQELIQIEQGHLSDEKVSAKLQELQKRLG